jgi:DNA polymerase-4
MRVVSSPFALPVAANAPPRWVLHIDLNAFFANAEVRRRPELRGRPVIVGGDPNSRGVVASASYEARARGVRSAMPLAQARRLCPDAVFLHGDFPYYRELSGRFRAILREQSEVVEVASIDEAYLEVGSVKSEVGSSSHEAIARPDRYCRQSACFPTSDFRLPTSIAHAIKARLREEVGLVCSIGIAPNKTLAKVASDLQKPDGLVVVRHGEEAAFLAPLPVGALPGIGPKAQERLRAIGMRRIGDLASAPEGMLRHLFGERFGADVGRRARGIDDRALETEHAAKTIGHETTFQADIASVARLRGVVRELTERTAEQLRRAGLGARIVVLKVRDADFEQLTRQRALRQMTELADPLRRTAESLLDDLLAAPTAPWAGRHIRLLGVRVGGLAPLARQLELF